MSREKQKQFDEINRSRNEELFNNLDKQYQEIAKIKAESEQIEEMEAVIESIESNAYTLDWGDDARADAEKIAEHLYNAGYRKQNEGEWMKKLRFSRNYDDFFSYTCSKCGSAYEEHSNFCPNCGASMRRDKTNE